MPALNAERYIDDAIASVVAQSHDGWELIVVDDGSNDGTVEKVDRWRDKDTRIRLLTNESSLGIGGACNRGASSASADLIARLDADDLMAPDRLAAQVSFLDSHPDVVLCGSWANLVGPAGEHWGVFDPPVDDSQIRRMMLRDNPFVHSSVMFRRQAFLSVGGYGLGMWEDYELWVKLSRCGAVGNIPLPLVSHRRHDSSYSSGTDRTRSRLRRLSFQVAAARANRQILRAAWPVARSLAAALLRLPYKDEHRR